MFWAAWALWLAGGLMIDLLPIHQLWARVLIMGGGMVVLFLLAGRIRRTRQADSG